MSRLVGATAISSLGDGFAVVAFSLLALHLTSSPLLVAGVVAAGRLPWLVVGLPAGALVDRLDRRRLVVGVDLVRGLVVGLLALGAATSRLSLADLYAGAFLIGTGETVVSAATRAVVPLIVGYDSTAGANGRVSAASTFGARFAGPALGGAIYSVASSLPFLGDAISYVASALLLGSALPPPAAGRAKEPVPFWGEVRSGLSFFSKSPTLRVLAGLVGSFAFCQAAVFGVLVIFATRALHLGETGYGLLLGAAAIGDVSASLVAGWVHHRAGSLASVLAAGLVAGAGYVLLASTTLTLLAAAALAIEAGASSIGNVATLTMRQAVIPNERFGVVSNAFRVCIAGLAPLGALVGGGLAEVYGTRTTFVLAGVLQLVVLALLAGRLRSVLGSEPSLPASATACGLR